MGKHVMPSDVPTKGEAALDFIVQSCAPALAKAWNGEYERVAMIMQKDAAASVEAMAAKVGFASASFCMMGLPDYG